MSLDVYITALILAFGLAVAGTSLRTKPVGWLGWVLILFVSFASAIAWSGVGRIGEIASAKQRERRPIANDQGGYISSDQCRACHPHHYDTWHASHHRTMTQVTTDSSVIANFEGKQTLHYAGKEFRFFQKNDEFFMEIKSSHPEQSSPDANEKQSPTRQTFQLVLSTGAHHQQAFWWATDKGRTLGKIPFIWITSEQRWVPYSSIFLTPPTGRLSMKTGAWNRGCIKCHVVRGRPRFEPESDVYDTHVAEFGISCEACHGAGEEHAVAHRNLLHRYEEHFSSTDDPTLISPADLSHEKSSHTCGQCHSVFQFHDDESRQAFDLEGFAYRPGDDLHDSRYIFRRGQDEDHPVVKKKLAHNPQFFERQFWSDGMVRVSGREFNGLLETPCYQHGTMSCLSCHEMHPQVDDDRPIEEWANDQLKPGMRGNEACVQCHDEYQSDDQLALHTHHSATSEGSRCYNCHMPHTTLGLMKAMRSHTVDTPSVQATVDTGRPNACNLCHLDETLGWTAEHLADWYDIASPSLSQEEQEVASSVRWILKGDAGQRAIVGWHLGWGPAQEISGTNWMAPYLAELLTDSYDVVRFIGYHSLKELPDFADFEYDFVAPEAYRQQSREQVLDSWNEKSNRPSPSESLLIDTQGTLKRNQFQQMRNERLDPPVILSE